MDKELIVSHEFTIPCYMFDCRGKLRPSAFMDIAQELAAEGSERLGVSDATLRQYGMVWIIARMTFKFKKYPLRWENVIIETWHKKIDGPFFIRDYRMKTSSGEILAEGTSSWILMNPEERRLIRNDNLPECLRRDNICSESAIDEPASKVVAPRSLEMEKVGYHIVRYSDLDYNGHVNNAKYCVWAIDSLPLDLLSTQEVKEISINFNREAVGGELVELYQACTSSSSSGSMYPDGNSQIRQGAGNCWYIEGRNEVKGQIFICEIIF